MRLALRAFSIVYSSLLLSFFLLLALSSLFPVFAASGGRYVHVEYVIDGDTIVTASDEYLRYIGIDTPEQGEYFFDEAREKNMALLGAGPVRIVECAGEKNDKYGRTLVWVYSGGRFINGELLSGGFARALIIPPCGLEKRTLLERLAWQARSLGRGIWAEEGGAAGAIHLAPSEAASHIGEMARVEGVVSAVRTSKRAVFIDFGPKGKRSFTAVVFKDAREAFLDANIDLGSYSGKKLSVTGILQRYKGRPEIIVVSTDQLRP